MPTKIYHITALDNIESIFQCGALHSVLVGKKLGLSYTNIAYTDIQDRRASFKVPLPPKGVLHDYVPFYFAPRSPMLYAIKGGCVRGYTGGQENVVYFASSAEFIDTGGLQYVFTDGHAIMNLSEYYNRMADLNQIDWDIMKCQYWNDTSDDGDRKRRRQAEFLVYEQLPLSYIHEIVVMNDSCAKKASTIIVKRGANIPVRVDRTWYY